VSAWAVAGLTAAPPLYPGRRDGKSVTNLNRLLQRLCDAEIEFVIVGGFAAMLHGSTLLTRDLDICAVLSSANVEKLRDILRDLHPTHRLTPQRLSFLDNPSSGVPVQNLYLETELGSVDPDFDSRCR
jgi:hypothetical protein